MLVVLSITSRHFLDIESKFTAFLHFENPEWCNCNTMTLNGPHIRSDVLTGQQIIVAPRRSQRPSSRLRDPSLDDSIDPFTEGNEHDTPDERFAVRAATSSANGPGWKLRVVPNRYPSVEPEATFSAKQSTPETGQFEDSEAAADVALFPSRPAIGEHDVVIECPDNRCRMVELTVAEIQQTLIAWRTRMQQLMETPSICSVAIFRNEGFSAGASLAHCHSQIVATTEMTPLDIKRHELAIQHRSTTGRDLVQDLWQAECRHRIRLVTETASFGVYSPFASRTSWQIRFQPIHAQPASLADASDAMLLDLATLLKDSLWRLEQILEGPFAFNLTLSHPRVDESPAFSWYLDLLPRTGRIAGWELLTNVDIVTVSPETAAMLLRETMTGYL